MKKQRLIFQRKADYSGLVLAKPLVLSLRLIMLLAKSANINENDKK